VLEFMELSFLFLFELKFSIFTGGIENLVLVV
jgi:hypothetical protein